MTIEEIFSQLAVHMIQGLMVHEQLANYYDFLALEGYQACHEYHHLEQTCAYRRMYHYYVTHFHKLINTGQINGRHTIPQSWYKYTSMDVDPKLIRQSVETGINIWVNWEQETKALYQKMYIQLQKIGEIGAAAHILTYIQDVEKQLATAEQKLLRLKGLSYDIIEIIAQQKDLQKKYEKKMK